MRSGMRLGALALALLLSACSSIPIGGATKMRGLDIASDDVASLLLAFDLPLSLRPSGATSTLGIDIRSPAGERLIKAVLVRTDPGELAGTLPPPGENRVYHLFALAETDRQAIRDAQAWGRTMAPGSARLSVIVTPALCSTEAIDPGRIRISALAALPGATGIAPLLDNVPLNRAVGGRDVPACASPQG